MAPKVSAKAAAGRAKKQENADKKSADAAAKAEAAEAAEWDKGAKGKSTTDAKAEKAAEAARKKAEREALLAEEEASLPKPKKDAPKAGAKKGGAGKAASGPPSSSIDDVVTSLSASNINDALDAMDFVSEKTSDKAAMGSKAAKIDSHPERRFKAAFEAWKESETPRFKEENPGLRKTQLDEIMYKAFQKAPENPFNQLNVAYDADKETKLELLQKKREQVAKKLGS